MNSKKYCKNYFEIGFYTGSTALHLIAGIKDQGGRVTSICLDDNENVERGMSLLDRAVYTKYHRLIRKNSNQVLPELFLSDSCFDFSLSGWLENI
ncbi:MAG: class I SAM-dependent methyltransferase [Rhodospirillales bacterium]